MLSFCSSVNFSCVLFFFKKREKRKKWKKKEKKGKKENSTELQEPNVETEVYNNKKCDWIYTYTYTPIGKIKKVQQK